MGKKKEQVHEIKVATVDADLWRTAMFGMNDSLRKIVEDSSSGGDESGVVFDINAKDPSGATPLIYASRAGHCETIQFLVDNGADVHEAGYGGLLPLHLRSRCTSAPAAPPLLTSHRSQNPYESCGLKWKLQLGTMN